MDAHLEDLRCLGIDEVGRGPLAGPVVAAGVILDKEKPILGLNDSKKLSAKAREALAELIYERALLVSLAEIDNLMIDRVNIYRATHLAMRHVVTDAFNRIKFDCALIDGRDLIPTTVPVRQKAIIKGDSKVSCIMAASIIAKVHRDRIMDKFAEEYPAYDFKSHKGYATKRHLEALREHGPCAIHRMSFMSLNQPELL